MKNSATLIAVIFLVLGCSNDDNVSQIAGNWKLVESRSYGFQGEQFIDYSNDNIIFNFQANGILIVTGGDHIGYASGEYKYFFAEDYLGGDTEPKVLLLRINDTKWMYDLTHGKMTLGQSYVDGPNLIFERN